MEYNFCFEEFVFGYGVGSRGMQNSLQSPAQNPPDGAYG